MLLISTILLALHSFKNITATGTKSKSIPALNSNFLEDMPECVQQLRETITQCETKYRISDHYVIDLKDERTRRKICCNEWLTIECIMKKAIDIPECGQRAVKRLLKTPIIPFEEEIYANLCNQYIDYKDMCNSKTNPIYNYEPMIWVAIISIFIFSLIYTYPDVLTACLRFTFR
jgi:hypothetical protein